MRTSRALGWPQATPQQSDTALSMLVQVQPSSACPSSSGGGGGGGGGSGGTNIVATSSTSPNSTTVPSGGADRSSLSPGAIAGITIACVAVAVVAVVVAVLLMKRRQQKLAEKNFQAVQQKDLQNTVRSQYASNSVNLNK